MVHGNPGPYREHLAPGTGERPLGRRFVDDSKVTDHHAIIPTTTPLETAQLSADEHKIYDLICRRLLSAWHDDHIWSVTTIITAIRNDAVIDRYHTSGSAVQQVGWKVLDLAPAKARKIRRARRCAGRTGTTAGLASRAGCLNVEVLKKKTRPQGSLKEPCSRYGNRGQDSMRRSSDAMKETGLGTRPPALPSLSTPQARVCRPQRQGLGPPTKESARSGGA